MQWCYQRVKSDAKDVLYFPLVLLQWLCLTYSIGTGVYTFDGFCFQSFVRLNARQQATFTHPDICWLADFPSVVMAETGFYVGILVRLFVPQRKTYRNLAGFCLVKANHSTMWELSPKMVISSTSTSPFALTDVWFQDYVLKLQKASPKILICCFQT